MKIATVKEAFNRNISFFRSKLNIELWKNVVRCYVWRIALFGSNKIGAELFGELRNVVLEENGEDKMIRKLTNEKVLERIGEKSTILYNILHRKAN